MSGITTSAHDPAISDDRLKVATGRSRRRWFALLDKAGAENWDRRRIVRWLGVKHEVDAWWAQSLTIDYERARHQGRTHKGPLRTSAWKTIRRSVEAVWPFLDDDDLRRDWFDCEFGVCRRTLGRSLRLEAADGSLITAGVHEFEPTSSGESRTQISVEHSGLHDAADVAETKEFWRTCLVQLAAQFERPGGTWESWPVYSEIIPPPIPAPQGAPPVPPIPAEKQETPKAPETSEEDARTRNPIVSVAGATA